MKKALIAVVLLFMVCLAFGQGSPHTIYGTVLRYEGTPPPDDCVHFLFTFGAHTYDETSPDFTYYWATGNFFLQIADDLFAVGDTLWVEIGDSCLFEDKLVVTAFEAGPMTDLGTIILDPIAGLRPQLMADYMFPTTGYVTDDYEYGVTYLSHPWTRPPGSIGLWIDDVLWRDLDRTGTLPPHYELGEPFNTIVSGYDIGKGLHYYYFYAVDDIGLPAWTDPVVFEILNTPPTTPEIHVDPEQAFEDEDIAVTIDVPGGDEDDDPLTYLYEWYRDGVFEAAYSGLGMGTLPSAATVIGELWEVRVYSFDGEEYSADYVSALASIIAPVLSEGQVDPLTGDRATLFTYTVTYSNLRDIAPTDVSVIIDGGAPIAMAEARDYTTGVDFEYSTTLDLGSHTYRFTATDALGHEAIGDIIEHDGPTVGNNLPTITGAALVVDPEPATERSIITAVPSGWADADGDPEGYHYEWFVNDAIIGYDGAALNGTYFDRDDVVYCIVIPFDGIDEGTGIATDDVVIQNALPDAPVAGFAPDPVYDNDNIVISITTAAYDPDGDALTYHYAWFIDDEVVGDDSAILDDAETAPGDIVDLQVWANDGFDDGAQFTTHIPVEWPILSDGMVIPDYGSPIDIYRYEVVYTSERDIPPYIIFVNIDGEDFVMTAVDPTDMIFTDGFDYYLETTLPYGDHTYFFTGTDVLGNEAFGEGDPRPGPVQENDPPVMTDVDIEPYPTATEVETVRVTAEGTDADGDFVSFQYQWHNFFGPIPGATLDYLTGADFDKGDIVRCEVWPFDGWDLGVSIFSDEVEIINTLPTITSVDLIADPDGWFHELGILVAVIGANDVDGDVIGYDITWFVNGVAVDPGPGDPFELDGASFDRGDEVYFTVTVSDDEGDGDFAVSDTVIIGNAPPVFGDMFIDPAFPTTVDILEANVEAEDPDGDPVTLAYDWLVDGEYLDEWNNDYVPAFMTGKHELWRCEVTLSDGMGGVSTAFDEVTILNTPPQVGAVEETLVVHGVPYYNVIRAFDPDADYIVWRLIEGPEQLLLDSLTGDLAWLDFEEVETLGVYPVSIIVTDGEADVPVVFNLHVYPIGHEIFAPQNMDALSGYILNIPMSWDAPAFFESALLLPLTFMNYEIERSPDMLEWFTLSTAMGTGYVDADVTSGTLYYYRVRAVYNEGQSSWSNIDYATPGTVNSNLLYSIYTYSPPPVLDGIIEPGEWDDATDFTLGSQTFYVKNTEDMLYIAFIDGMDVGLDMDDAFYVHIEDNHNLRWPALVGSIEGEYRLTAIDDSTSEATYQGIWGTYPGSIGRDIRGFYEEVNGAIGGGAGDPVVYELAIEINPDGEAAAAVNSAMGNVVGFRFAAFDAGALYWTRTWLTGCPATDPESFGSLMLGIGAGGPNFSVWRRFYEVTLLEGYVGTRPMWVSNLGNGSIEYDLYESYILLLGGGERDIDTPVLLYTEDMTIGHEALVFLGYPYETVHNSADFIMSMTTEEYDAVVVTLMEGLNAAELAIIEDYIRTDGKAIICCPDLEGTSSHTIWPTLGMEIYADLGSTPSALTWDFPDHPIFNQPLNVPPSVEMVEGIYTDYGDAILPVGATALASFDEMPYPANGAITLSEDGSLILNSFVMSDLYDNDFDEVPDGVELLINEIFFLAALGDVPWLSVAPDTGTLSSHETHDAVVTFDATALSEGDYTGFIMASSTDPATPLIPVPCILHVRSPIYSLVTLAFPAELQRVRPGQVFRLPITGDGLEDAGINTLSITITTNATVLSPDVIYSDYDVMVTDYDLDHITFELSSDLLLEDGEICEVEFIVAELAPVASMSNLVFSDIGYNADAFVEEVQTVDGRVLIEAGEMDWRIFLEFTHGFNEDNIYIGVNPLGSELFDIDLDMLSDPPASWLDPYSDVADLDPANPRLDGDVRSAFSDIVIWHIPVGDSAGKVEWEFRDEDTLQVMGSLYLDGDIDMKTSSVHFYEPHDTLTIVYRRTGESPFNIDLYPGWNMVSLPIVPTAVGNTPGEVYPAALSVYYFDAETQGWTAATTIDPGVGYVLLSITEEHYTLWGQPVESYTYGLIRGWNLIGATFETVNFSSPTTSPPGAIIGAPENAYYYDVHTDIYLPTNELDPGKGYFVATNINATLEVPGLSGRKSVVPGTDFEGSLDIEFDDAEVNLKLGAANTDWFKPMPPSVDGSVPEAWISVEDWRVSEAYFCGGVTCDLVLNGPATVSISGIPEGMDVQIGGRLVENKIALAPGIYKVIVGELPRCFALHANAPNPFNPATMITFDIPQRTDVDLEVYDLLGKKVKALVGKELSAGSHRIVWNGTDDYGRPVPSGVYFYRITAGEDCATRRMILLK